MSFYHDVKPHLSPSAMDAWYNSRGSFIRSYFDGIKSPETASMFSGKRIHALIQGGLLPVKHRYEHAEQELIWHIDGDGAKWKVLGRPDSYGLTEQQFGGVKTYTGNFVDYKSGKENTWDASRLATDIKMKLTAYLVWCGLGFPDFIEGYIEYIPTRWNEETREIEPTGAESEVVGEVEYTAGEMKAFESVIVKTMQDINVAYEEYLTSTDEFVNQDDVATYADYDKQIKDLEARQAEVRARIADQMAFGKKESISTLVGTFFFTNKKKWAYPPEIDKQVSDASVAKKKWETENAPESVTKSLSFRARKV